MKYLLVLVPIISMTYCLAQEVWKGRMVLKLGKEQSLYELLKSHGIKNLDDQENKIGNYRKVIALNKLTIKKAKRLPEGFKVVIPKELEKYFIIKNEKVEQKAK